MNFTPGKKYVNRKGDVFIFVDKFTLSVAPLLFKHVASDRPTWRTRDGKYLRGLASHEEDIVAEYVEPNYVWVNLYTSGCGTYQPTREAAIRYSIGNTNYLSTIKINLNTGEVCKDS